MFPRNILLRLSSWAEAGGRKPLVLRGARQVGKTVAAELFARQFDTFVSVNLDAPGEGEIFRKGLGVQDIFQAICLRQGVKASVLRPC